MMKPKKNPDPTMRMPGALLWLFCAPVALVVSAHYDAKRATAKRQAKAAKKEAEFRQKYPEWWFYSD